MKNLTLTYAIALLLAVDAFADISEKSESVKNYYKPSKSYGTEPESDAPRYVNELSKVGIKGLEKMNWLDVGLQYRLRFESRDNDFRRSVNTTDTLVLSRARVYFAVKNILDPLRFTVEIQDSKRFHSKFIRDNNDIDEMEFIQSYAELHFKDGLASLNRPISIRAGRMAFEALDRRLIARNEWRNTTNNFQGFRAIIGENKNDWQLDNFALQPIVRSIDNTDHSDKSQWFYGSILNWRRWSDNITLQPFYFRLDQKTTDLLVKRTVNSEGLRGYGVFGKSGFDYDFISVFQQGNNGNKVVRAFGGVAELGYSLKHNWQPRFSFNYGYGSGDSNPSDSKDQRFEKLFGFGRPWSANDYFQWENIKAAKTRIEIKPTKKLRADGGYSNYWLSSNTDRWNKANLRDKSGKSGDFIGYEYDARLLYKINNHLDSTLGYAYFAPGGFTKSVARSNPSNFFYLELVWSLF